jgi:D-alanyl-D-alanine carboxypeptidase
MSAFAAGQPPSKLGIKAGGTISVRDAILALVTKSANDVATAIAEHLAGTEKAFAQAMTTRAHQLGMSKTTFRNAHGLPNTAQVTTARDMAVLGRALQDHFPQYFSYFSTRSFSWKGSRMGNHNRLLGRVEGVTGIKTGYTRASGFNLVTSVDRGGRQIVAVVIGGDTGKQRDNKMAGLIETYLPKASRGQRTAPLIARGSAIPMRSAANIRVAVADYPMPRLRPTTTVVADAAPLPIAPPAAPAAPAAPAVAQAAAPAELPETAAAFASASVAQIIGANSIFALEAIEELEQQGDAGGIDEDIEAAAPAPATAMSGWKIQIAATPTQTSAEELLASARAKAPQVLADATPYTEPVEAGNATLYRARFGGFADKESARDACAYLTKKNFNCLAISN